MMRRFWAWLLILGSVDLLAVAPEAARAACTVPNQLTNGQTADASQVMANFNSVLACTNSAPAGSTNALQYNAGSGTFGAVGPLTNGQIPIGSTGNAPSAAQLTAGTGITITNGAGTIRISSAVTPYTIPKLVNFTWGNQPSGATAADTSTGLTMSQPANAGTDSAVLWNTASYPSVPTSFTIGVDATVLNVNYENVGMTIGDGTGKLISFGPSSSVNSTGPQILNWTSPTTYSSTAWAGVMPNCKFFAIKDDGTNLTFFAGADLNAMIQVFQESRTAFLSTPSQVGFLVDANNATYPVAATFFDSSFGN